uniref:(northern house mosquito) hypothetical protein n=1 Tax=Culex pipiens TaxID=7175 RepID=A0A8D8K6A2_CULPI
MAGRSFAVRCLPVTLITTVVDVAVVTVDVTAGLAALPWTFRLYVRCFRLGVGLGFGRSRFVTLRLRSWLVDRRSLRWRFDLLRHGLFWNSGLLRSSVILVMALIVVLVKVATVGQLSFL